MSSKTKIQYISENAALRARVADLETKISNDLLSGDAPVENDPSEPIHNEDVLKASEIRYRRLFETAQDGILILDARSGKIVDANPFMEEMLGYSQAELVGKALWEIGLFKDIFANRTMYRELKEKGYVRYEDLPLQTKNGEQRQVEFVSNIYQVDNQSVIQCNIRDISNRKDIEAKEKTIHDELVASMAELQRHDRELQSLYNVYELLQSCNSQDEAFKVISMLGIELFDRRNGCLAIFRPLDQYLEVAVSWGDANFMESNFLMDDCWALRLGQLHIVKNPQTGLICHHFSQPIKTSYLCMPLMVQGETIGLVSMLCSDDEKQRQRQEQLAVIFGDAIKLSLSNLKLREKLREQALTDQLTGLGNRFYLEESLSHELARALRRDASVCVAMVDIDHFKKFNDTYGHDAGDMLLRKFGELLRKKLRQSDIKCRYGGDEFVIVLLDSTLMDVRQRLEKIQGMVKEIEIQRGKERFGGITLSIGIVEAHESNWTPSTLLHAVDEALYAAKNAGRDCIVVYPTMD